jgi:hypothetical protein
VCIIKIKLSLVYQTKFFCALFKIIYYKKKETKEKIQNITSNISSSLSFFSFNRNKVINNSFNTNKGLIKFLFGFGRFILALRRKKKSLVYKLFLEIINNACEIVKIYIYIYIYNFFFLLYTLINSLLKLLYYSYYSYEFSLFNRFPSFSLQFNKLE